ncbi:hypothetical protein TNCV_2782181 [Trichonephila clavipes]|nr:hypothetical protein TNCV_2782181 [Trichonephila clavipes]
MVHRLTGISQYPIVKYHFTNHWIGHKDPPDKACISWPPYSPDLTPCDFYLSRLRKDCVYVPPLPADLSEDTGWKQMLQEFPQTH